MSTKNIQQKKSFFGRIARAFFSTWIRSKTAIVVIVSVFFLMSIGIIWMRAYMHADVATHNTQTNILWYPAIYIAPLTFISGNEISRNVLAVKSFYEKQDFASAGYRVDFSTQDGRKRLKVREKEILNILIEQEAMRRIVEDANMRVTDTEVSENVDRKLREFGSTERVEDELNTLYGWDLKDFKERVVKPAMYREKAKSVFAHSGESDENIFAKEKIAMAKNMLDEGEDFASVAKQYSEGVTAQDGGYFGWLSLGEIVEPEIAKVMISLEADQTSDVIESDVGYHIVKIHGTKKDSVGVLYDMSQIFVAKVTFAEFLRSKIKAMNVRIALPGYRWNADEGLIEFSDPDMREFEVKMIETLVSSEKLEVIEK